MKPFLPLLALSLLVLHPAAANVLVNGDFETGDLTGWTDTALTAIDSTTPLAGTYSAVLPDDPAPVGPTNLAQTFAAQTEPVTTSFLFSMADPAVRGLQVILRGSSNGQINLQVVDLDDDGDGDVQIYDTILGSYQTVLTDAVTFGIPQTFSLTINQFGATFDYDLAVGSKAATGLSFWQNSAPGDLNELVFENQYSNTGYEIDNVEVITAAIVSTIVNGDFETGDFTGWTNTALATIDSATPLAGAYSAVLPDDPAPAGPTNLAQTFAVQTAPINLSFLFSMADPAQRGLQLYFRGTSNGQINLQVVDLDNDGDGDVQIYDTTLGSFQTVLTDAVTFGIPQSFSLTINRYGATFDYDLIVAGRSATGLSFWQNSAPSNFDELVFVNEFANTGFEIDDVKVEAAPNRIDNGGFEMGDFTAWTNAAGATIDSTTPLDGTHAATLPAAGVGELLQALTPGTGLLRTQFVFSMDDPGSGDAQPGLQVVFREQAGTGRIHLQIVDLDDDGDGDIQVYNENLAAGDTGWRTVLPDAVVFGATNALSLTFKEFGALLDYEVCVNGSTAADLGFWRDGELNGYDELAFSNEASTAGYEIDAVRVALPAPVLEIGELINGGFETGDFTAWTNTAGATIDGATPLLGTFSARLPDTGSGEVQQSFASKSGTATTTFVFEMADPGNDGTRGLNVTFREDVGNGQVNLRVVDLDDDGDGDVQIYNQNPAAGSTGWKTVLTDAVTFGALNTLALTFNGFGGIFDYEVTVNGSSAPGLRYWQNQLLNDYHQLAFTNAFSAIGFEVDGVMLAVPPDVETSIWDHINVSADLSEERGISTTFTGSGATKAMRIDVTAPVLGLAWATLPPPPGGWNLGGWRDVSATVEQVGGGSVQAILWVVGQNGWSAVGDFKSMSTGSTRTLTCALRSTFPDGTPKINPGDIAEIRVMLQSTATTSTSVIVSDVNAVGELTIPWVRPADRIDVPNMESGAPQPGKRVLYKLPGDEATNIYMALYLPDDWKAGLTYPVIGEFPGNIFFQPEGWSPGRPEQCMIGYGVSKGRGAIWVSLPFIDRSIGVGEIAENGFGNTDHTTQYTKDVIAHLISDYGADPDNLFLSGFSRGAIACGYIGLRDPIIGALWKGFIPCQHYDGSAWNESNMPGALSRAPNFQGESIFQTDNSEATYGTLMDVTPGTEFWAKSGLNFHDPAMFLDDRLSTRKVRRWFHELVAGTTTVSEDFAAGQGAWAVYADNGNAVFAGGTLQLKSSASEPASAYLAFPAVALFDGESLSLTADVSTPRSDPRPGDIRLGLGFANPPITANPTSVFVPLGGYSCWIPSGGDSSDSAVVHADAGGGPVDFFSGGASLGAMTKTSVSKAGTAPVPCEFTVSRVGNELVFCGSIDGHVYKGEVTATGTEALDGFRFNTIALGCVDSPSDFVTFDNVRLELVPVDVDQTGYDCWEHLHGVLLGPQGDDDGDGFLNLLEFGIGGDPKDADDFGHRPVSGIMEIAGSDWFTFTHPQLSDPFSGIRYFHELSDDLLVWRRSGYVLHETLVDGYEPGLDQVSIRVIMDDKPAQFVRLGIEMRRR